MLLQFFCFVLFCYLPRSPSDCEIHRARDLLFSTSLAPSTGLGTEEMLINVDCLAGRKMGMCPSGERAVTVAWQQGAQGLTNQSLE